MNAKLPKQLNTLTEAFSHFPGIGEKTALRFVLFLLQKDPAYLESLATQIDGLKHISSCPACHNISERGGLCRYCSDPARDAGTICVVSSLPDLMAIEATSDFLGHYHILNGRLDPLRGILPEQLNIETLMGRVRAGNIKEIILALNPDIPGESTILYLTRLLRPLNTLLHQGSAGQVKITRLARGIPMGGELEYADPVTLSSALEGRQAL
jgi:recombination protein RecR